MGVDHIRISPSILPLIASEFLSPLVYSDLASESTAPPSNALSRTKAVVALDDFILPGRRTRPYSRHNFEFESYERRANFYMTSFAERASSSPIRTFELDP